MTERKNISRFITDPRYFITYYLIGYLLRGFIAHFIPFFDDFLQWSVIIWFLGILCVQIVNRTFLINKYQIVLLLFGAVIILPAVFGRGGLSVPVILSFLYYLIHATVFFPSAGHYEKDAFSRWLDYILSGVCFFVLLIAVCSLVFFLTYRAGVVLPFGLNSYERIFTYGHLGNEDRFCGLFGYSTNGGHLCIISLVLSLLLYERKKIPGWLTIISVIVFACNIILLDVRADMILLMFCFLCLLYRFLKRLLPANRYRSVFWGIVIGVTILGVIVLRGRIVDTIQYIQQDPYNSLIELSTGRTEYWYLVIKHMFDHPVFGWGWLNSEVLQNGYYDAHNLFINLLMWSGFSGFILFLVFLIMLFVHIWKTRREIIKEKHYWAIVFVVCIFLESMLDIDIVGSGYNIGTSLFWIFSGLFVFQYPLINEQKMGQG